MRFSRTQDQKKPVKPQARREGNGNDSLYVRSAEADKSFYINLFVWSGSTIAKTKIHCGNYPQGIESQFLIDTGASISILNFETFKEIQRIHKHVKLLDCTKIVLAANEQPINMLGMADIACSYDADDTFPMTHRFWIYGDGQGKQSLLGMDFINKECTSMNFTLNELHHKRYPGKVTELRSTPNKNWPFTTQIYPILSEENHVIEPRTMQLVQLPNSKSMSTKFLQSVTTEKDTRQFPTVVENPTTHPVTWTKGKVGHIGVCLARRYREPPEMFNAHNYSAFVGALTEFGRLNAQPENEAKQDSTHVNFCAGNELIPQAENLPNQDHDYASKIEDLDIENMDCLYENFNVLFAEPGKNQPANETKCSKFQQEFGKYSAEEQALLNKFDLTKTDLTTDEKLELFEEIIKNKDVYSHHKYDIVKIDQKCHIRLKPNAELKKQRPSNVPLHYRDKLADLLEKLEKADIIKNMGSDDDLEMGSEFINPVIILPKGESIKLVLDARYLNSMTDLSSYSWPLEPLTALLTRIRGQYFSTSDLSYAYSQVPLTDDTKRLVSFVIGDTQYQFLREVNGLNCLPSFFSRVMTIHFVSMIRRKAALTYLDDIMLQADSKQDMFQSVMEYHALLKKAGLKAAPEKTKCFLQKVKFLGHMISGRGISPVATKVEELKKLKSPENKRDVLRVLGCLNFYYRYIRNLHVNAKPLYELVKDETVFEWTDAHEKLFQTMKDEISADTVLAIPNEKYPFFIHTDASIWGAGAILVQLLPEGKRIVSFNSRVFDKHEQQLSTLYRELAAVIFALQTYEYVIIGSKFPISIYCDHRPILFLWARKGQQNQRFFKYQITLTKFQNLKIICVIWLLSRLKTSDMFACFDPVVNVIITK